jgi:hypothetical protein
MTKKPAKVRMRKEVTAGATTVSIQNRLQRVDPATFELVEMTDEEIAARKKEEAEIAASLPPPDITRRQFRLWMLEHKGKSLQDVHDAITATIADPLKRDQAHIEFDEAHVFSRSHPMFDIIGAALGFATPEELTKAFHEAGQL